ncbi:chalcone isomerase family protein [Rhodoferax mekongensis]|uniref:chalcone isomerase family protein n=1 Tax=Rhodoferax mekongensis TaxID=3068341 RepID=UPI0028BD7891|nr:chalcone isomerase family protein [Rhodoferax sp. TBRC 17199]MDT7513651.1 chalcone isomerase family protein [Rhodoferax sp. TBRC 17199]
MWSFAFHRLVPGLLSLSLASGAFAQATAAHGGVTVDGVVFDKEVQVAGSTLRLNGAGLRTKFVFKVYAAGLYLATPARTPADIYAAKGPKRLKVSFVRETDATTLGKTMSQVMSDNLPREQFGKCIPGLVKLGELFSEKKKMGVGEMFTVDEIQAKATVISINNKVVAEISEPEFFACLMYNYFGERPADANLKAALLGGT